MRSRTAVLRLLALLFAFALAAAACGDSDSDDGGGETESGGETTEASDDTEAADTTEAADDGGATETTEAADDGGDGGGEAMVADGEPIKIGIQNPEGDPNGSFPEYTAAARAAAEYVNTELGGLGGRPIELEICTMAISPDESQRCANELASEGIELAFSTLNFFGNHFPIYQGSDIPVLVGTPITIGDFTAEGVYSIGAGGGCLGQHTGLVYFATQELPGITGEPVNRVAVPWADTPPGVVCYYDLEAKPLNVLNGSEEGASQLAGSMPDLEHIGVPVLPAQPDVTPQATEVLNFDPDVILFSAQGADCWTFVDALGRLGWTPDDIPLVLSGACVDFTAMQAAGDLAVGIYFMSSSTNVLGASDDEDAAIYQEKSIEYGLSEDDVTKGFATQGFNTIMTIYQLANGIVADGGEVTGASLADAVAATDGSEVYFGGTALDCASAPAPYIAVCDASANAIEWDGEALVPVTGALNGIDLVAGTELRPGPS